MENRDNFREMMILLEFYRHVQRYRQPEREIKDIEKQLKDFKKYGGISKNEELEEIFNSIIGNIEREIKNLKKQGVE